MGFKCNTCIHLVIILFALSCAAAVQLTPGGTNVQTIYYYQYIGYRSCNWVRRCKTKYRPVQRVTYNCAPGWSNRGTASVCPYPLCGLNRQATDPGACNIHTGCKVITPSETICQSGGLCSSPYRCVNCNHGHYTSSKSWGYCALCKQIDHCNYTECTQESDNRCKLCEGEYRHEYGCYAYTRFTDDGVSCKRACSWRAGSRCFPGNCSDTTINSCTCAPGYSGTDCATIDVDPVLLQTEMIFELIGDNTVEREIVEGEDSHTSWTSLHVFTRVAAKVQTYFNQSLTYSPPSYIDRNNTRAGILRVSLNLYLFRDNQQIETYLHSSCEADRVGNQVCHLNESLDETASKWKNYLGFDHGDMFKLTVSVIHGGKVYYYNRDKGDQLEYYNLIGKTSKKTLYLGIDRISPVHCCTQQPFYVPDATTNARVLVRWDGWTDALSGIDHYEIDIFHLSISGGEHNDESVLKSGVEKITCASCRNITHLQAEIELTRKGTHALFLIAFDKAKNHASARQIIVFDDDPVVHFRDEYRTIIKTASVETNHTWISQATKVVEVDWRGRFISKNTDQGKWLNKVENVFLPRSLDDYHGKRTVYRKQNVRGIVTFAVSYKTICDDNITEYNLTTVSDLYAEGTVLNVGLQDGMRLSIHVRAYDIFDSFLEEIVNVSSDFSPPVIRNLWLVKGDRLDISVHNMREFSNLTIEWELYDLHSGIQEVYWRLFDNHTSLERNLLHGASYIPPQGDAKTMSECIQRYGEFPRGANCYCTPFHGCYHRHFQVKPEIVLSGEGGLYPNGSKGLHDGDYYLQVAALNGALLRSVHTIKITIDTSPPHEGTVGEGFLGDPEVDFQNTWEIYAYWSDFFDKESGVMFYRYNFGKSCLTADKFFLDYTGPEQLTETYVTQASFTAPEEGTYHVTIAAYNHALEPSKPVCSDGVTIDTTVPKVTDLKVETMKIRPAVVKSSDNLETWYISKDRELYRVLDATRTCIDKATVLYESEIAQFPMKRYVNGTLQSMAAKIACKAGPLGQIFGILPTIHNLTMSWKTLSGPSGVYDHEVGISSTNTIVPNRMDFISTKQHSIIHVQNPNILSGERFYVLLRTISKSSIENVQIFGPFIVDTTKPSVGGDVSVELKGQYLEASWSREMFIDEDDPSPLTLQFALGHEKFGTDVIGYADVQSGGSCEISVNPVTCTAIRLDHLHWALHENRNYYVTIKAENTAGLVALASSDGYLHSTLLPTEGVVVDIDISSKRLFQTIDDIDFQTSTSEVSGRWYGFYHPHLDIVYHVCVGEKEDVMAAIYCVDISNSSQFTFTNLNLQTLKKYYFVVTAVTNVGNITQFSNGFTVVDEDMDVRFINITDGPSCDFLKENQTAEFTHHSEKNVSYCSGDIDFQSSMNHIEAHWTIPENMTKFISVARWKLQEKFPLIDHWKDLNEYEYLPTLYELKDNQLVLQPGKTYRVAIQLCADRFCYQELFSDGVTVIPNLPITGSIDVHYNLSKNKISVTMEKFKDPDVMHEETISSIIDYYEWALTDNSHIGRTITPWSTVQNITTVNTTHVAFEVGINESVLFSKCWRLSIRGVTFAKLSSALSTDIKSCNNISNVRPNIVIDAVGKLTTSPAVHADHGREIYLEENNYWHEADRDYTPYNNIISAVWPTLRYKEYKWAVIEETILDPSVFYNRTQDLFFDDPCSHPHALQCGTTDKGFMNAVFDAGVLQHGKRYIVCIHANATELAFEKWTMPLSNMSSCSDGITVDLTPPIKNSVWIGQRNDVKYQNSLSDMSINWNSFTDIEEHGFHVHSSGIQRYEVAIGTSKLGVDVLSFQDVGLVNHVTLHNLRLQGGYAYFASVKAYDHVNHTTISVSSPVVVDTSPPLRTDKKISIGGRHITSKSFLNPCWKGVFYDRESGISKYEWSIGSRSGYEDIMAYTTEYDECGIMNENANVTMKEGHAYYVSVKAQNGVGLRTISSSWAFVVDATPPISGCVEDGPLTVLGDIDFQTNHTWLSAKWTGFHDPHTAIKEYYVSFGTCANCDDIIRSQPIGIRNEMSVHNLKLTQGKRYYCIVTACNTADLCTTIASDGVIIDSTPPVRGRVLDGREGHDIAYQSSKSYLAATWFGFWDSQSGLSRFVWRVGTTKGGDDILPPTNIHLFNMASVPELPDANMLPNGKKLYITVRAYNKAGLYAESSSNGFIVDVSPPNITKGVELVSRGSITPNTLVYRSAMKIQWEVQDEESYIDRQYVSIQSHINGDFSLSATKINGIARDYTFTGLDLHDGSYYDVTLISCNGAGLCSNCTLPQILVDSSPPKAGMFAISTDHASQPQREPEGWMTWSIFYINLAWLGFTDVHSGIETYLVNVGSTYMGSDLNKVPSQPMKIGHDGNATHYSDEGFVQTGRIDTRSLKLHEEVFISMWAVNKVGLTSPVIHSLFTLTDGGDMELIRRCSSHSCLGHCVCAPHGEKCVNANQQCKDATNGNFSMLVVLDVIDFTFSARVMIPTFTFSNTALAAEWNIVQSQGKEPLWYEWSIGYSKYSEPKGVFNQAVEQVWFDAGQRMRIVSSLPRGKQLEEGGKYSFFIRAWYDSETFATFQSAGLIVSSKPPQITNILGKSVKELVKEISGEIDYIKETNGMMVDWSDKFLDENSIEKFQVYMSTIPGGHDVHVVDTSIDPNITHYDLSEYAFEPDITFYTNVVAYNYAGLYTTVTSDGFCIDKNPPAVGVVLDGSGPGDNEYQNSSTSLAATWHGFEDLESGVMRYIWCVTTMNNLTGCDILAWQDVHLNTRVERQLAEPLQTGTSLIHKIMAMDVVGHLSSVAASNGVLVDTTAPIRKQRMDYGENLVFNPSFESFDSSMALEDIETHETCSGNIVHQWTCDPSSCVYIISSNNSMASNGKSFAIIKGFISQEITNISIGVNYRITFFTSHLPFKGADGIHNEGYIKIGNFVWVFILCNRPQNLHSDGINMFSWQKHTFYFIGSQEKTLFKIGSYDGNAGLALDDVRIQSVTYHEKSDAEIRCHITAHTVFLHDWSPIHAEWDFYDPESPVIDYMWAIGTTEGGTQLQDFQSVGTHSFASNSSLHLSHNSKVHITVVATNAAGLKTVSCSDPIFIDFTPPVFGYVNDGEGFDVDHQISTTIQVNWQVYDSESAIQSCQWAIGSREYATDIQEFINVDARKSHGSRNLTEISSLGLRIFSTLRCTNNAGLTTTRTSDGVRITQSVLPAPSVMIEVLGISPTEYTIHDSFLSDPKSVRLRWTGFEEEAGIVSFLVDLSGPDTHLSEVVLGEQDSYTYATFQGLHLRDGVYMVSVTGMNEEKFYSEKISTNFTLYTQEPMSSEEGLRMTWDEALEVMSISWESLFNCQYSPLYYEVSVGFTPSGGDIIQWQETRSTSVAFSLLKKNVGDSGRRVYATVRAIAPNGLYSTVNSHSFLTV